MFSWLCYRKPGTNRGLFLLLPSQYLSYFHPFRHLVENFIPPLKSLGKLLPGKINPRNKVNLRDVGRKCTAPEATLFRALAARAHSC